MIAMPTKRVACIYLPSFSLQVHVRHEPHLAKTAFAIAGLGERPAIVACSRQAWAQGVRPGMSATQGRAIAPALHIVAGDLELCRQAALSLGESLLSHSVTVDIGGGDAPEAEVPGHKSIYLHVPRGARGASFGAALLEHIDAQGFRARVGVADDCFTARVAAITAAKKVEEPPAQLDLSTALRGDNPGFVPATVAVPRGGSAAFLAPQRLELLPGMVDEVRNMLHTLGVHTLGDFASLPPPSVGVRWNRDGVDYQALARGDDPRVLTPLVATERIVESVDTGEELEDIEPISFLLRPLLDRACDRLRGRGMAAGELVLTLFRPSRSSSAAAPGHTEILAAPSRPTLAAQTLQDLLRAKLSELTLEHRVSGLCVEVTRESEPEICELDLFDHRDAEVSADAVDIAIARLQASLGEENVSAAELVDTHRPEKAFRLTPFSPPRQDPKVSQKRTRAARGRARGRRTMPARRRREAAGDAEAMLPVVLTGMAGALRLVEPPEPQGAGLRAIHHRGCQHRVVASHGPRRLDGEWWTSEPLGRDYYEVETDDGGRFWVYREARDGRYYLHGVFD